MFGAKNSYLFSEVCAFSKEKYSKKLFNHQCLNRIHLIATQRKGTRRRKRNKSDHRFAIKRPFSLQRIDYTIMFTEKGIG